MARFVVGTDGQVRVVLTKNERARAAQVMANAVTAPAAPAVEPSKRPYTCEAKGCYKFGHTFTENGWNGDGTNLGHRQISPFHK